MNMKITYTVIPAKAGIQRDKHSAKRTASWFRPATRELFKELDSRLRGNDGILI